MTAYLNFARGLFSIACERNFKDANGEKPAEFVSKYMSKGRMAVVDGRLQLRDWVDRDGNKRRSAEIVANGVNFGDSKPQNQTAPAPSYAPAGAYSGGDYGYEELEGDGDLPF